MQLSGGAGQCSGRLRRNKQRRGRVGKFIIQPSNGAVMEDLGCNELKMEDDDEVIRR